MTLVSLKPVIGVVNNLMPVALGQTLPIVPKLPDFQAVLGNLLDMLGPAKSTEPPATLRNVERETPDDRIDDADEEAMESDGDGRRIEAQVLLSEKLTAKESSSALRTESTRNESNEEIEPARKAWSDTLASSERTAAEEPSSSDAFATTSNDAESATAELTDVRSNPSLPGMSSDDARETLESTNGTAIADPVEASETAPETEDAPSTGMARSMSDSAKTFRDALASSTTTMRGDEAEEAANEGGRVVSTSSSFDGEGISSWETANASVVADEAAVDASSEPVGVRSDVPAPSMEASDIADAEIAHAQTDLDADPSTMEFSMESDGGEGMTDEGTPANDTRPTIGYDLRSDIAMPGAAAVAARVVPADQTGLPVEKEGVTIPRGIDAAEPKNGSSSSAAGVREAAKSSRSSVQDRVEFIDRIVRAARVAQTKGQAQMKIVLQPRHLGNLKVDLTVEEKVVVGTLRTESVQTKDLIISHLGELKDALQQQGLKVGDFSVAVQQDHSHSPSDRREREEGGSANDREWLGSDRAAEEPAWAARPRGLRSQLVDVLA